MKRNPELAHNVTMIPEVRVMRHRAIERVTEAALLAGILGKTSADISPTDEIELEIRLNEALDDAGYEFRKYLREKIFRYENELHKTIAHGNDEIVRHSDALNDLRIERGI